jgi:hypothetical protein
MAKFRKIPNRSYDPALVGEKLGAGATRRVFAYGSAYVIKFPKRYGIGIHTDHNRREAALWDKVKHTPDAKHFAAVVAYCPDGHWLIMLRANRVHRKFGKSCPEKRVLWLERRHNLFDIIPKNTGAIGKRFVLIDYAR